MSRVRPSQETRKAVEAISGTSLKEIQSLLDEVAPGCRADIEGSVAKGTYLENQHDIDIFAFFPAGTPREELERVTLKVGKLWARGRRAPFNVAYAEHPYVRVLLSQDGREIRVDVVGAYLVESTARLESAVDRTRFHTQYVKSRLTPTLRDQVLLTKQFMKGIGVYGSEVRIGGFSGLLCEVLTLNYGSFIELIKSASNWRVGQVIDPEGLSPAPERFSSPLVVIDPTDGNRNAAAAVSGEKMATLIHAARRFLKEPREEYFFPLARTPLSQEHLRRINRARGTRLFLLRLKKPDVIDDILYPQLERMISSFRGRLEEAGFTLVGPRSGSLCEEEGRVYVLFEVGIHLLPHVEKRLGPRVDRVEHSERFLEKHSGRHPYLEGTEWCVDAPRRFSDARSLLEHLLSKDPQGIIPSHVKRAIKGGWELLGEEDIFRLPSASVRLLLTNHFVRLFPWEVK